jgi:SulP family sulfate permease
MDRVPYIDQSGLYAVEEAIQDLEEENITVAFTCLHGQPEDMLKRFNIVPGLVDEEHIFDNFQECMAWLNTYIKENNFFGIPHTQSETPMDTITSE